MYSRVKAGKILAVSVSISLAVVFLANGAQAASVGSGARVVAESCSGDPGLAESSVLEVDLSPANGGYSGHDLIGDNSSGLCNGHFGYVLSVPSAADLYDTVDWQDGDPFHPIGGETCDYSVYIPSIDAGGLAKYFVYGVNDSTGNRDYLFNKTVDQEATSGWVDLGTYTVPANDETTYVELDNVEPARPNWDVAFDAVAFKCS